MYAGTAYEKAYDGAVYTKVWNKDYEKAYAKDYSADYTKAWNKIYTKDYEKSYDANYQKDWVGPTYYGGFASGADTTIYQKVYTKIWEKAYSKDYSKAWDKVYTKIWSKDYVKNYVKTYTTTYQSTYVKEYIGGYEGVRNFTADVGFVNLITTVVYTSARSYQADGLYFGDGIVNYRGSFDGLEDYSTDYTKIWLGNENYLRAWNPTYTGDQYFETQWSGSRTSHNTFVGNTNFVGVHSGALSNTKPRLFLKKDDIWEQAKKLWIREDGEWKEVPYQHTKDGSNWKLSHIGHKHTDIYLNNTSSGPLANTADAFYMRGENDTTGTPDTLGEFSSKGSATIAGHNGSKSSLFVNNFNLKEFLDHKGRASGTYPTMTTIHVGNPEDQDTYYSIGSNTTAKPAIDLTGFSAISINQVDGGSAQNFPHLVRILVHHNGYITGCGGAGGNAAVDTAGADGANGGTAIKTDAAVTLFIENYGTIGGGGGGGGAGGLTMLTNPATGAKSTEFAAQSGSGGGGGSGSLGGAAGTTASAVLTASVAGSIIKGGAGAVPNIITTHNSRVPGGKGGDLGAIGYGANMDTTVTGASTRTKWAMSGDGGTPGSAIEGYDASRVLFVGPGGSGRGLIAGDETFKLL